MNKKIIIIVSILAVMLIVGFWIARRNIERVEKPVRLDEPEIEEDVSVESMALDQEIGNYLTEYYGPIGFDGRAYCDYEFFGSEKEDGDQSISYYLWAFCQEYYIDQEGEMKKGMQLSGPVVITGQIVDGKVVLLSHQSFEGDSEAAMDAFPQIYHYRLTEDMEREARLIRAIQNRADRDLLPGLGK